MKKFLLLLCFSGMVSLAYTQTIIAQWNFDTPLPPDFTLTTGNTLPSMGNGATRLVNGAAPSLSNPFSQGSDNDHFTNGYDNSGWNITQFPAQGTGNKTRGIQFVVNTNGFTNIKFRYDEKRSNSAANTTVIQYNPDTLNAAGWTDFQTNTVTASIYSTDWFTRVADFSAITAMNNQPRAGIRVVAAFDPANGLNYISTLNQTAASYNATGGTIRFDMVTITGLPDLSAPLPSVQASTPVVLNNIGNSIQFSFERGNGDGALILCRAGNSVNAYPVCRTSYTASNVFGSGSPVGTGNYVVHNTTQPGKNTVTITGLTAGTAYHFFIFEYTASGMVYNNTPLYFHASCGGTLFKPGELLLLGFDARVPGAGTGNDAIYISPLTDITPGTQFNLTSSRFEAGAAPNTRTNRWYNSGDHPYNDCDVIEFTWMGATTLSKGSIITIRDKFASNDRYDSVMVNGVYEPLWVSDKRKGSFNIPTATPKGEQVFLTQGSFYPMGELITDRYNLLSGRVLFGITLKTAWVPFAASPGTANTGIGFRESRIPPDILCLNISNTGDTAGVGVYNMNAATGTPRSLMLGPNNNANWVWKIGDATQNIAEDFIAPYTGELGQPLTVLPAANTPGTWVGDKNTDWFDCGNWEALTPPDSAVDVTIPAPVSFNPQIAASPFEPGILFNNKATARSLNLNSNSMLTLGGNIADSLWLAGDLNMQANAVFNMNAGLQSSKLGIKGNWHNNGGTYNGGTDAPVHFNGTGLQSLFALGGTETFGVLYISADSLTLNNTNVQVQTELGLQRGKIKTAANALLKIFSFTGITSPVNNYGNANQGYAGSFVEGPMALESNSTVPKTLPIGKGNIFAPVTIEKFNTNSCTYTAEYFNTAYTDLTTDLPTVDHVSSIEHWQINTSLAFATPDRNAKITLFWGPHSAVNNSGNWQDSIMVAHYFDNGILGTKWFSERDYTQPNITGGSNLYGSVTSNRYVSVFSPFTLGAKSPLLLLPFRLISFGGHTVSNRVQLQWLVAEESGVNTYVVERSTDGVRFTTAGTVFSARSVTEKGYAFNDDGSLNNTVYYRLKIRMQNGEFYYSRVIKIAAPGAEPLLVYPNPARSQLTLQTAEPVRQGLLEMYNARGERVYSVTINGTTQTINIQHLPAGVYQMKLQYGQKSRKGSFVKL